MSIEDILNQGDQDLIDHLGIEVIVNGIKHKAIFDDDVYPDEAGSFRLTTISVLTKVARQLRKGDIVYAKGRNFKIHKIPDLTDGLIDIELKDA